MVARHYLDDALSQLKKLKAQADKAFAQIDDCAYFALLDPDANSVAHIVKHMAGNMRSRWTDFLTTDGEKPDRDRDSEFELTAEDTRARLTAAWEAGWATVFAAISPLTPEDLERTVYIRGEAHTVLEAMHRQALHYAGHVGQIVLLGKHYAGPGWTSLSIPKGMSKDPQWFR